MKMIVRIGLVFVAVALGAALGWGVDALGLGPEWLAALILAVFGGYILLGLGERWYTSRRG